MAMYRLNACPRFVLNKDGYKVLKRVCFTASDGTSTKTWDYPVPSGDTFSLITALVPGVEKGIRANQALNRGECIYLGMVAASDIADIGFAI